MFVLQGIYLIAALYGMLLLLQLPLLAAADRYREPGGRACCGGSLHLIPVFLFSSFKHDFFQHTRWQYYRIFSIDFSPRIHVIQLRKHRHARSEGGR